MSDVRSRKGGSKLASVLQRRMKSVSTGLSSVVAERGEIVKGKKLKLYSLPDAILDRDDYSVCVTVQDSRQLKVGDRVLVIWTLDGEPVVIDRIAQADSI